MVSSTQRPKASGDSPNITTEAVLIPWEISALNLVLTFWRDDIPLAAVCAACIVLYGYARFAPLPRNLADLNSIINLFAVKWYGESEFWLSSGKLLLIIMLFCFTFITMVGGNPHHDAYGFRYWREPVSVASRERNASDNPCFGKRELTFMKGAFAEYVTTGSLGRFEGFLAALWKAA
jgi:yeast amino acid transporter